MLTFVTIVHVLVCVFMIFVILLQPGKDAGMGSAPRVVATRRRVSRLRRSSRSRYVVRRKNLIHAAVEIVVA